MNTIEGVDLKKVSEQAQKAFTKIAEGRLVDYVRGLKVQAHNQRMKAMRLANESQQAEAQATKIEDQISKIENGQWEFIEPMELADKGGEKEK